MAAEAPAPLKCQTLSWTAFAGDGARDEVEVGAVAVEAEADDGAGSRRLRQRQRRRLAGARARTAPASARPGRRRTGEPCSERSGVTVIVVPSGTAPAGIASVIPPAASVPPPAPTSALDRGRLVHRDRDAAVEENGQPDLAGVAARVGDADRDGADGASAGTRKLACVPVARRPSRWPPTVTLTFGPPKPFPLTVTSSPRCAAAGLDGGQLERLLRPCRRRVPARPPQVLPTRLLRRTATASWDSHAGLLGSTTV